jgi:hypothetical protein
MSNHHETTPDVDVDQQPKGGGPDLALIYCLIVVAILVAIAFAVMIVLPYYNHR